jgi:hypothetical protein
VAPLNFEATLVRPDQAGAWTYLVVPFDVRKVFGSAAQVRVKGTLNGVTFRGTLLPRGGATHILVVNKTLRDRTGVKPGDCVVVAIEADETSGEELAAVHVPEELAQALSRDPRARESFERLAPSHRKEYGRWVDEAKRADTRARRAARAVEMLLRAQKLK